MIPISSGQFKHLLLKKNAFFRYFCPFFGLKIRYLVCIEDLPHTILRRRYFTVYFFCVSQHTVSFAVYGVLWVWLKFFFITLLENPLCDADVTYVH